MDHINLGEYWYCMNRIAWWLVKNNKQFKTRCIYGFEGRTADYGTIAVYNSWFSIIQVFATLTMVYPGILQVGLYEHSENRWKYLSSV